MNDEKRSYFVARYRALDTDELAALHRQRDTLADEAISALDAVLLEKGLQVANLPPPSAPEADEKKSAVGVGGWLLLLIVSLLVLVPLLGAGRLNADIVLTEMGHPNLAKLENWKSYKSALWAVFSVVAALSFWAGFGLARSRNASVVGRAKIVLWLIGPLASFVAGVFIPLLALGKPQANVQVVVNIVVSALVAALWTAYLSKSKRVRATYTL